MSHRGEDSEDVLHNLWIVPKEAIDSSSKKLQPYAAISGSRIALEFWSHSDLVFVFYCCCKKLPQTWWLKKENKFIILRLCRIEVWRGSQAKIKVIEAGRGWQGGESAPCLSSSHRPLVAFLGPWPLPSSAKPAVLGLSAILPPSHFPCLPSAFLFHL